MITKRRKLKTGQTLWQAITPHLISSKTQPAKKFYDVVVVGGGVSGALTCVALAEPNRSVLLIDRRQPGQGSTSASTALIQWEIDEPLTCLTKKLGTKRAVASYSAAAVAVRQLSQLIKRFGISCDLKLRPTLLLAGTSMGAKELRSEANLRRRNRLPSTFLTQQELLKRFKFSRAGAIYSKGSLELDPLKLPKGLLKHAQTVGVEIVSPSDVTDMFATPNGVFLTLDHHLVIAASKVIMATGYESLPQISRSKHKLNSTWALATKPLKQKNPWPQNALVWEASDPYLYFRTTAENRIIVGGEDEDFQDPKRRDAKISKKSKIILRKLGVLLDRQDPEIDFEWAGTFATTPTGLPIIGEVPNLPNVFTILGAGGNGITFSMIASKLALAWVKGTKHPLSSLFAPA